MSAIPDDIDQIASGIMRAVYTDVQDPEWEMYKAIATAILAERQRAVRSPNHALLLAAKTILSQWDEPRRARTQYTAQLIQELRAAVDEAESVPTAMEGA